MQKPVDEQKLTGKEESNIIEEEYDRKENLHNFLHRSIKDELLDQMLRMKPNSRKSSKIDGLDKKDDRRGINNKQIMNLDLLSNAIRLLQDVDRLPENRIGRGRSNVKGKLLKMDEKNPINLI